MISCTLKKILFLTASYPDARGSATMLCTHRVMEYVAGSGRYEVHALAMRRDSESMQETAGKIMVHRFRPSLWTRVRNRLSDTKSYPRIARMMEVLQKAVTIPSYPNVLPVTGRRYFRKAARLHGRERFDIVISEYHGIETLLAGCRLKKAFPGLKHIALLWDPVMGQIATGYLPGSFTSRRIERLERLTAACSTALVSTRSMRQYYMEHGDIAADIRVYLDIPGVRPPGEENGTVWLSLLKEGCINIVFSGLLSVQQRNPLPVIRLLGKCKCAGRINLVFFSTGAKEAIENEAGSFPGSIVHHDYIPIDELHTVYRHADYLLNVSHINANMVPSKIFEYMSFGKPVISTYVTPGDSAARYLGRYPEALCIDLGKPDGDNVEDLEHFLSKPHAPVPFELVREEFKENTSAPFLALIDKIAGA